MLLRLRQIGEDLEDVRDLSSLIESWMTGPFLDASGVGRACELLAEACRFVLRRTDRGGGLPFTEAEGNGNVVDFLSRGSELRAKAENMVKASDVYFPTLDRNLVAESFRPSYFNLYGQKPAEDPRNRERNDKKVFDSVREIAENKGQKDESGKLAAEAATRLKHPARRCACRRCRPRPPRRSRPSTSTRTPRRTCNTRCCTVTTTLLC